MTLPLIAVVLIIGLLLHAVCTSRQGNGMPTLAELGRAMIWVGLFFLVWVLSATHGDLKLR